jgi:hypothetical protein
MKIAMSGKTFISKLMKNKQEHNRIGSATQSDNDFVARLQQIVRFDKIFYCFYHLFLRNFHAKIILKTDCAKNEMEQKKLL